MGLTSEEVRLAGLEYLKYSKGQINKKKQQKDNN